MTNLIYYLFIFFINNFKIYRNNYCFFKIFYFIFVALIYKKQYKITNIFTFILEFYKIKIKNIVESIFKSIQNLNKEIDLIINRKIIFICAFKISLFNNIL